jgi:aminodeoxychorismate synthase component I
LLRGFAGPDGSWHRLEVRRAVRPDLAPGVYERPGEPLARARELLAPAPRADGTLPFVGGAVGYLGYELAAGFERLAPPPPDDLGLPDLTLLWVDRLLAFDHATGAAWAVGLGYGRDLEQAQASADDAAEDIAGAVAARKGRASESAGPRGGAARKRDAEGVARAASRRRAKSSDGTESLGEAAYGQAVEAILERIAAGDAYQACLTQAWDVPFDGDPWRLYRALRAVTPAPFAAYLELPEATIVGSSPERFLRVTAEGRLESRPIKGTRRRGSSPEADVRLGEELAGSAKDRAENLMIVDLVRNDLGRVCATGSVEVPELFRIEAFARVFQMVSVVSGRLAPGRDALDAVRAAFPPGSMTGAPKLAAMDLLSGLETLRRGPYAGALGYLDVRGGADLSVVIRSLVVAGGLARAHAGGGVVADSTAAAEYAEAQDKVAPLLEALAAAGSPLAAGPPRGRRFSTRSRTSLDARPDRPIP